MRLSQLEATFVGKLTPTEGFSYLPNAEGAQGLLFLCPLCFAANHGSCGTHSVLCWFSNPRNAPAVPPEVSPKPGRWQFTGDSIEDVTLSPSVHLSDPAGCGWHGWVKNGFAA
jgi:hypothetical protein